jgi:hypothetical protein
LGKFDLVSLFNLNQKKAAIPCPPGPAGPPGPQGPAGAIVTEAHMMIEFRNLVRGKLNKLIEHHNVNYQIIFYLVLIYVILSFIESAQKRSRRLADVSF